MTVKERVLAIRLMQKMEQSNSCTKDEDGTLKYINEKGDVLIEARMKERD